MKTMLRIYLIISNFALILAMNNPNSPSSSSQQPKITRSTFFFGDILQWIGQIPPKINEKKISEYKQIMQDCLVYLDENGGLESGKQFSILDELFEYISKLDVLIDEYKKAKKAKNKEGTKRALELVEQLYEQQVDNKLLEAINYLFVEVNGQEEDGITRKITFERATTWLAKLSMVLPNRRHQILDAVQIFYRLFRLPNFQLFERNSNSDDLFDFDEWWDNLPEDATGLNSSSEESNHDEWEAGQSADSEDIEQIEDLQQQQQQNVDVEMTSKSRPNEEKQMVEEKKFSRGSHSIKEDRIGPSVPITTPIQGAHHRTAEPSMGSPIAAPKDGSQRVDLFGPAIGQSEAREQHPPQQHQTPTSPSSVVHNEERKAGAKGTGNTTTSIKMPKKKGRKGKKKQQEGVQSVHRNTEHPRQQQKHFPQIEPEMVRSKEKAKSIGGLIEADLTGESASKKEEIMSAPHLTIASSGISTPSSPDSAPIREIVKKKAAEGNIEPVETKADYAFDNLSKKAKFKEKMGHKEMSKKQNLNKEIASGDGVKIHGQAEDSVSDKADYESEKPAEQSSKLKKTPGVHEETQKSPLKKPMMNNRSIGAKGRGKVTKSSGIDAATPTKFELKEDQKELEAPVNGIVNQFWHLQTLNRICQLSATPLEKEYNLKMLKSNHMKLMELLEDFVLNFGEKYGKPITNYFEDILLWIGQFHPAIDGKTTEEFQQIVDSFLVSLDQGKQLTILDDLFKDLNILEALIKAHKKGKGTANATAITIERLDAFYMQKIDGKLREALSYLIIGLKRQPGEEKRSRMSPESYGFALVILGSALPNRKGQTSAALKILKEFQALLESQDVPSSTNQNDQKAIIISAEDWDVVKERVITVIEQNFDLRLLKHDCEQNIDPTEKEKDLRRLKSQYLNFMEMLENFVRDFGEKYYGPRNPYPYFGDIMNWIVQLLSIFGITMENKLEQMKRGIRACFVYLDNNGGMEQLKEQGKQLTNIDAFLRNMDTLERHVTAYEDAKKALEEGGESTDQQVTLQVSLQELKEFYMENVDGQLREALGYLFVGIQKKQPGSSIGEAEMFPINEAYMRMLVLGSALESRHKHIWEAMLTLGKLLKPFGLPDSAGSPSSSAPSNVQEMESSKDGKTAAINIVGKAVKRQELERRISAIINHIYDLETIQEKCEGIADPNEKEDELRLLKSKYLSIIESLEEFVQDFGEVYGTQGEAFITRFSDILFWIGLTFPAVEGHWRKLRLIMLECLKCLDDDGGLTHLKEHGKELTNFDEVIKNIDTLDRLMIANENAKKDNTISLDDEAAIKEMHALYENKLDAQLREALGYVYIGVKKKQTREEEEKKAEEGNVIFPLNHAIVGLTALATDVGSRREEFTRAAHALIRYALLLKVNSRSVAIPEVSSNTISSPSSSFSHLPMPQSEDIFLVKIDGASDDYTVPSTPAEFELESRIRRIIEERHRLKSSKRKLTSEITPQELQRLSDTYKNMLALLKAFVNDYGEKYNWDGKRYIGDVFNWIFSLYGMKRGEQMKLLKGMPVMEDMEKSLALLDENDHTNFGHLIKYVSMLSVFLKQYKDYVKVHGKESENSPTMLKELEQFYLKKVDPELREAFSFQFIGMRETIAPANKRVERMRKSMAQKGLILLSIAVGKSRQKQIEMVRQTLEQFFDTWTEGMETLITADLPGYVAKILGNEEEEVAEEKHNEGHLTEKKTEAETVKKVKQEMEKEAQAIKGKKITLEEEEEKKMKEDDLRLGRIVDKIEFEKVLKNGLEATNDLLANWEPPEPKQQASCSTSSTKKSSSKKGRKAVKARVIKEVETKKVAETQINQHNWRQALTDVRKMIRYMNLLQKLLEKEGEVDKVVDIHHVHVRVWEILFDIKLSPVMEMKEVWVRFAEDIYRYFAQNGEHLKGTSVREALKALVTMEKQFENWYLNMHSNSSD